MKRTPKPQSQSFLLSFSQKFTDHVANFVKRILSRKSYQWITVLGLTFISLSGAYLMSPPAEYLPTGNRNLIFGVLLPPPGYNLEELNRVGETIKAGIFQHFDPEKYPQNTSPQAPLIDNFFYVAQGRQAFMGAVAKDPDQVKELIPILRAPLQKVPGMIAIITQSSLFGRTIGTGRSIEMEVTGPDLNQLLAMSGQSFFQLMQTFPGAQLRPKPSLDLGNPEVHITPDREKAALIQMSAEELGEVVDVILDGRKVSVFKDQGEEIDLILKTDEGYDLYGQDIKNLHFVSAEGKILTLGSIAEVDITNGPEQINHLERQRAITLSLVPSEDTPLETAMQTIEEKIIAPLKASGQLKPPYQIALSGTADDLVRTKDSLKWNFILALVITYLLMTALFSHYLYPFVIMFSVPLASIGGFLGLWFLNTFITPQPLDILTMLGFVILVGTVVNNAILIVHYALQLIREENLLLPEAMRQSVKIRIRPIFMSTLTSVFGMLPLVLFPGAGSELYRGIGSVVVGGLVMSTVFTLILIPAVFSLTWDIWTKIQRLWQKTEAAL